MYTYTIYIYRIYCTCMFTHINACMCIYVYTHVYVYTYIHTYMHATIHTYTHGISNPFTNRYFLACRNLCIARNIEISRKNNRGVCALASRRVPRISGAFDQDLADANCRTELAPTCSVHTRTPQSHSAQGA